MSVRFPKTLIVDAPGMRLDQFLARHLIDLSRSHLKKIITRDAVRVDGKAQPSDYRLHEGQTVVVGTPEVSWPTTAELFERWVLHEDSELLVLAKPAGLLMHPLGVSWLSDAQTARTDVEENLAGLLLNFRPAIAKAALDRCGIVHRLDRQTSGVLLVAKTKTAQDSLVDAFKKRIISKIYRALVRGVPVDRAPRISAPIGRKPGHRRVLVTPFGKNAETAFRVIDTAAHAALVEARPLTGRTHQIRAHLAYLGYPVLGDPEFDTPAAGAPHPPRTMLHAYRIEFQHPKDGKIVSFSARPPRDFTQFWEEIKKHE